MKKELLSFKRFESLNENIIYLDGTEEINWNVLRDDVMKDSDLKNVDKKEIDLVLKSVRKWLVNEHWAFPGAFED